MKTYKIWAVIEECTMPGETYRDLKDTQVCVGKYKTLKEAELTIDSLQDLNW